MTKELIYGKLVGETTPPQVQAELAEWDRAAGKKDASPADWACGPDRALEALDDLNLTAYLLAWHDDPLQVVCLFQLGQDLYVTHPASETDAANSALHFVVQKTKSVLT